MPSAQAQREDLYSREEGDKVKLYKRYYPIKTNRDIYSISGEDCVKLVKRIKKFKETIKSFNTDAAYRAKRANLKRYTKIELMYSRDLDALERQLRSYKVEEIDEKDILLINAVLYAYKLSPLYLIFSHHFPTDGNEILNYVEAGIEDRNP